MHRTDPHTLPMALLTTCLTLALTACGGGGGSHASDSGAASMDAQSGSSQSLAAPLATMAPLAPQTPIPAGSAELVDLQLALAASSLLGFKVPSTHMTPVNIPFNTRHEGLGAGVPLDYDWAEFSRLRAGNQVPSGMGALTGWGQAFWIKGAPQGQAAEIRGNQTYLCEGATRRWLRVQNGDIEGSAFRPDFSANEAVNAQTSTTPDGTRVSFPADRAYHWWPKAGRAVLPSRAVCGVVVLFEARAVATDGSALPSTATPSLLIGAGADYWTTTRAAWDNNETNPGIALGQLRKLTTSWRWYGLSTASSTDLSNLQRNGFVDKSGP